MQIRPTYQIDAIGHRREDAVHHGLAGIVLQAFQRFLDGLGLAGKFDDQRLFADDGDLPRQYGGGHEFQTHLPHLFAKARHFLVRDRQRGLGGDVTQSGAGTAGGQIANGDDRQIGASGFLPAPVEAQISDSDTETIERREKQKQKAKVKIAQAFKSIT